LNMLKKLASDQLNTFWHCIPTSVLLLLHITNCIFEYYTQKDINLWLKTSDKKATHDCPHPPGCLQELLVPLGQELGNNSHPSS
jgi:hypothetical protein